MKHLLVVIVLFTVWFSSPNRSEITPYSPDVREPILFVMGTSTLHKLLLIVGFVSLFHAAFSAAQHRSYLRITAQEFTNLPVDIVLQGIISLFLVMYGVLSVAGEFKEIRSTVEMSSKTWETQRNIPSFYTFNHRGRALSPNYIPQYSKSDLENIE